MIYFVQPLDGGPVKIGYSDDVEGRVKSLEHHYGQPLSLLATIDGGREEEKQIHARFAHLRFGRTEQFRPALDLMAFIGRPLLVGANPDAVEAMEGIGTKPIVLQLRGSAEYRDALEELAKVDGLSLAGMADLAIRVYARHVNFTKPIPKR